MKRIALVFAAVAVAVSGDIQAVQRTFVSGTGIDTNPCSRTQPCRTFVAAMAVTDPGGEVIVLDSGGYGTFQITTPVTIAAPSGVYAGITVFGATGILVNAGATDKVILRGLTLNSLGGFDGIRYDAVGVLFVENVVTNGFTFGSGVTDFSTGSTRLYMSDTRLLNGQNGLQIAGGDGEPLRTVVIDHCRAENNTHAGFDIDAFARFIIRDSIATGSTYGFRMGPNGSASTAPDGVVENCIASFNGTGYVVGANGFSTTVVLNNSIASHNDTGLNASFFGNALISNCTITRNTNGLVGAGTYSILSRGNNTIELNGTDGAPTGTANPK
jgi:copper-binding protein NosD